MCDVDLDGFYKDHDHKTAEGHSGESSLSVPWHTRDCLYIQNYVVGVWVCVCVRR